MSKFPPSPIDRNNIADHAIHLNVFLLDQTLKGRLANPDPNVCKPAAVSFASQSHAIMPNIEGLRSSGVVPILVSSLLDPKPLTLQEIVSAITRLSSISREYSEEVVKADKCVSTLISLLDSPNSEVSENVVNAIGTIALGNPVSRDSALKQGVLEPLLGAVAKSPQHSSALRSAVWALQTVVSAENYDIMEPVVSGLVRLIHSVDEEVIASSCWAFSALVTEIEGDTRESLVQRIQDILDTQIAKRLCDLLTHKSIAVQLPAVKVVCRIAHGTPQQIQVLVENKAITHLQGLLNSPRSQVRVEAARAFGNIAAGGEEFVQALIESESIPKLMQLTKHDTVQVAKEVILTFFFILQGKDEQVKYLVSEGCVGPLCHHILASNSDASLILKALQAIENVLEVGERVEEGNPYLCLIEEAGGVERFDLLQFHNNTEIFEKSHDLLLRFFHIARK